MADTIMLDEIKYESSIYPRDKWSTHTINTYVDALKGGAKFPPLILEAGTTHLLDGIHRWKAYLKYREEYKQREQQESFDIVDLDEWPEPPSEIEVEYHEVPEGVPAKLYAASLSVNHGDRIKPAERESIAREIYRDNPDFTLDVLRQYLSVSIGTAHNYVADILARRKEEQRMTAFRLDRLGWTNEEVGESIGQHKQWMTDNSKNFSELKNSCKNLLGEGHPHLDVAERYNMPLQLVWAIDLHGRTDAQRMDRLGIKVQPYDVWNFGKCHDLFGTEHPGRIPGQLVAHVLYFYTEPGAMVIDPMAGSGTTVDVCLAMGRGCYAYDIDQRHERPDIIQHDLRQDGWPDRLKKADLIFWDPPYFEKMDSDNIGQEGYAEGSISKLERDDYLSFFRDRLLEAKAMLSNKSGVRLAFLMSDWDDNTGERPGIFLWDYANVIQEAGWRLIRHIQVPLSTQQVHPDIVNKFRASRRLARLERYLLIAEV